jgi:hypothetical protein
MDTRKGRGPRQSCLDLLLLSFFSLSLSHTQLILPISMEPPPTPAPLHLHPRPMPTQARPTSPSPETPRHSRARPSGLRRRRQVSCCDLAYDIPCTPSSLPKPWPPPTLRVDRPPAALCPLLMHVLDVESDGRVLKHPRTLFPRATHHPAQHCTCNVACTLPCTRKPPFALAVTETFCTRTEKHVAPTVAASAPPPRPHH